MFPLADLHPYTKIWENFKSSINIKLDQAREAIAQYIFQGGRLSTHPGQFCVITSDKPHVVVRSMLNLELHADFFDLLMIPRSYMFPINIHLSSGKLGAQGADNAHRVMDTMSESLRHRLVFETEDKNFWTWQRIIHHFPKVPVTLDYLHRNINNLGESEAEAHQACVSSWSQIYHKFPQPVKPLFHYTEGARHALDRSHADRITSLPAYTDVDMEIEAKHKETAVLEIMEACGYTTHNHQLVVDVDLYQVLQETDDRLNVLEYESMMLNSYGLKFARSESDTSSKGVPVIEVYDVVDIKRAQLFTLKYAQYVKHDYVTN